MKQLFRAVVLLLLAGGWTLSASALHVIRTPASVAFIPKDKLGWQETWVDTRKWTVTDDQAHADVVAQLVYRHRTDLLRHTLPTALQNEAGDGVLAAIAAKQPVPDVATSTTAGTVLNKVEGQAKVVLDAARGH